MEGRLAVPFHFAAEFLVLVVAIGAALDALRARRHGAGFWSLGQAAGFATLAAAQVVHGGLLAQADADRTVIVLRAVAFLLLALAVRPGENVMLAPAAAAPALFFPGANPELAFAPAGLAFLVFLRGVRAHRKDEDPATFAFAAAFLCFAAAEAATAIAPANGGSWIAMAHGARGLAGLFLARWLASSVVRSVRMRFVAALVLVLTITVLLIGGSVNVVVGDRIQGDQFQRLADLGEARVQDIYGLGEQANTIAGVFGAATEVRVALATGEPRDALEDSLGTSLRLFDIDFIVALDARGRLRGAVEAVGAARNVRRMATTRAIAIAGLPVVAQAPTVGVQVIAQRSKGALLTELVTVGSTVVRGRLGVLAAGYRVDRTYLKTVKVDTVADATLVLNEDRPVVTTLPGSDPDLTFRRLGGVLRTAREENRRVTRTIDIGSEKYATAFVPIAKQRGSSQIVALLALSLQSDVLAEAQIGVTRTLFLLTLGAMLVAAFLAWLSGGRVTRPIRALTVATRELRSGNLEARTRVAAPDEVGALGAAFNEMAVELQRSAQTEAGLRTRLEAVLRSMGDGLIATDQEGRIVTFNRAAEEMFGRTADQVAGHKLSEVMHGSARNGRPLAEHAMRGNAATDGSLQAGRKQVPVALTAAPLRDEEGGELGRVIVLRDVSSEHQAERMKSEFLANVSHELRTPITPIKGYAEILSRKKFPREKMAAFLEGILESTERLERIADILVDFAALEAGRLKPKSEAVPVRGLVDGLAQRWRERDGTHKFVRKGGDHLPPVLGDQRLLDRSLDELVDNAVKFSPDGGPIDIIAEAGSNGRGRPSSVRITVRDRGIGIEPERMPELFQDFRQLDGSETRAYGGLGLGLAYVKRIATVHGGEVLVESKPGRGSSFTIVLPVAEAGRRAPAAKRAPTAKRTAANGRRR